MNENVQCVNTKRVDIREALLRMAVTNNWAIRGTRYMEQTALEINEQEGTVKATLWQPVMENRITLDQAVDILSGSAPCCKKDKPDEIMLKLTKKEASAIMQVFRHVGGEPKESRRGLIDSVHKKLIKFMVHPNNNDTIGSIYFKPMGVSSIPLAILELNIDDARALADCFSHIGGEEGSRIRSIGTIAAKLREHGIEPKPYSVDIKGGIWLTK